MLKNKGLIIPFFLLSVSSVFAQVAALDPKGAKKVRIETTSYQNSDTTKALMVLYFDGKGNVTKSIRYDAANDPLEEWTYSYKYSKNKIKTSSSKFKDYSKQLKSQKFKSVFTYNADNKLLKVESTANQSGYECLYDSIGRVSGRNDYNAKGFFGGAKYFYKDDKIVKQKYEWSNKPPETTEFIYDSKGRKSKAISSRGPKIVKQEVYIYVD